MAYLIDTTVLVDHSRDAYGVTGLLARLFEETGDIFICDAVVAEATSSGSDLELLLIDRMLAAFEYVSTSPAAARQAGAFRRSRTQASSRRIADALIAGVAWSLDATVVTRNARDFAAYGVPVLTYGQTTA